MRRMNREIAQAAAAGDDQLMALARDMGAPIELLREVAGSGSLPVVNFAAGGIATPSDAAMMMQLGCDGVFVGFGNLQERRPGGPGPGDRGGHHLLPRSPDRRQGVPATSARPWSGSRSTTFPPASGCRSEAGRHRARGARGRRARPPGRCPRARPDGVRLRWYSQRDPDARRSGGHRRPDHSGRGIDRHRAARHPLRAGRSPPRAHLGRATHPRNLRRDDPPGLGG